MFNVRHSYGGASAAGSTSAGGSGFTSAAADFIAAAAHGAGRMARNAVRSVRVSIRERKAVRTLSSLDDRTLKDIGVYRSEIPHLARRFANSPGVDYRVMTGGR